VEYLTNWDNEHKFKITELHAEDKLLKEHLHDMYMCTSQLSHSMNEALLHSDVGLTDSLQVYGT